MPDKSWKRREKNYASYRKRKSDSNNAEELNGKCKRGRPRKRKYDHLRELATPTSTENLSDISLDIQRS